jgi:Mrp family chromosome partitioning ATPase
MRQTHIARDICRIVVGSRKGGVGKSVVSVMLAAAAARANREAV